MKPMRFFLTMNAMLWSLFFAATLHAQEIGRSAAFEGIVHAQMRTIDELQFLELSVKRDRIRVDAAISESGGTYYLIDYNARKQYIVIPSREKYVELSIPDVRDESPTGKNPLSFEKTDSIETIAGYPCDLLKVTFDGADYEIWATTKLGMRGTFCLSPGSFLLGLIPWQREILRLGYFPLKIVKDAESGDPLNVLEAASCEKKSLSDTRFRIPPEYEKTTIDQLMPKPAAQKKKGR